MDLTRLPGSAIGRLKRERKPFRFLLSRVLWQTGLSSLLTIRFRDGFRIRFHPSAMAASLWLDPDYNREDRDFLRRYLKRGDIVVDVGANIGALSIAAATHVGPEGRVYSFEPHPTVYRYLRENIALNGLKNVIAVNCALAATPAMVNLSDKRNDDQNAVVPDSAICIPARRLDDVMSRGEEVNLLKIDVEGYERFVLEGAEETLSRTSCIYIEVSESNFRRFGYGVEDVVAFLSRAGFCLYAAGDELAERRTLGNVSGNVVAVRDADDFRRRVGSAGKRGDPSGPEGA